MWLYEKYVDRSEIHDGPAQFDAQMARRNYRRVSPIQVELAGDVHRLTAYYRDADATT